MEQLQGRVVAVTGTSRGVGVGIVERLLDAGASVLGVSRTGVTPGIAPGDRFAELALDVTAPDAPAAVADAAHAAFGRYDGLVNNAALLRYADCWEQSDEDVDAMLAVNLTAPFRLAQEAARRWVAEGVRGVVVNICSVESEVGWAHPGQAVYAATKGGLLGVTRALALDLARHGIRVCAVGPGSVETEMAAPPSDDARARIPLGQRFARPAEIGDAVVFLLSDRAAYVTGEILYVDGGYLLP